MFTSHTVKRNGREYGYYVCQKDDRRANAECPVHRIPADCLEKILLTQVGRLFRTPTILASICNDEFAAELTNQQTEQALSSIHTVWNQMFPLERYKLIHTLLRKVEVYEDKILIHFEAAVAHQAMALLISGKASTMREIADKVKMDRSHFNRLIQLANFAPDIVKHLRANRTPATLTLDKLRKDIPESWEDQRQLFLE